MSPLNSGPCEAWPIADCGTWPDNLLPVQDMAVMAATEILWGRTKRRFGACTLDLRPCKRDCAGDLALAWLYGSWMPTYGGSYDWGWPYPALVGGRWFNMACGCGDTCSCTTIHQFELPYPVSGIGEVKVDGVVLDPSAYRVDEWRYLVRLDGEDWPLCQDLNLPDTEVGTWSVTASIGEPVPQLGMFAVDQLARQIALGCIGSAGCALPTGTLKSLSRQGVEQSFVTGADAWIAGFAGMPAVSAFLQLYNPTRSGTASVYAIDGPRRSRIVGT